MKIKLNELRTLIKNIIKEEFETALPYKVIIVDKFNCIQILPNVDELKSANEEMFNDILKLIEEKNLVNYFKSLGGEIVKINNGINMWKFPYENIIESLPVKNILLNNNLPVKINREQISIIKNEIEDKLKNGLSNVELEKNNDDFTEEELKFFNSMLKRYVRYVATKIKKQPEDFQVTEFSKKNNQITYKIESKNFLDYFTLTKDNSGYSLKNGGKTSYTDSIGKISDPNIKELLKKTIVKFGM